MKPLLICSVLCLAAPVVPAAAQVVLQDGFAVDGEGFLDDVNESVLERQEGSAAPLLYEASTAGGSNANAALLDPRAAAFGNDACLLLRTTGSPGGGASETAVRAGGIAGLQGKRYEVGFEFHMAFAPKAGEDRSLTFALGAEGGDSPGVPALLVELREDGSYTLLANGKPAVPDGPEFTLRKGEIGSLRIVIDESAAPAEAVATLRTLSGGSTATLPPVEIELPTDQADRGLELRASQAGAKRPGGSVGDFRIDNLSITLAPAEPG
ncbi:hypothetical protein [Phycisphaera mikurensis]|uniref:Uncharacterized protein n=1 Tax=Phycisphaera mikurensis (strain NBRC 102666 / KCTC 22515 / FYK2301M01) TaxID=1142394 RepID=I0IFC2_PHYMF|nr:hypothetical protein [Phycisphaera mikurensis]MBB6440647.1 hypothetical protein [Phycisphaera mikurensis]BAM03960.1 hypothetical protein PSMK_18010 [Phycisphaera mikurensis NBRC 102666]